MGGLLFCLAGADEVRGLVRRGAVKAETLDDRQARVLVLLWTNRRTPPRDTLGPSV